MYVMLRLILRLCVSYVDFVRPQDPSTWNTERARSGLLRIGARDLRPAFSPCVDRPLRSDYRRIGQWWAQTGSSGSLSIHTRVILSRLNRVVASWNYGWSNDERGNIRVPRLIAAASLTNYRSRTTHFEPFTVIIVTRLRIAESVIAPPGMSSGDNEADRWMIATKGGVQFAWFNKRRSRQLGGEGSRPVERRFIPARAREEKGVCGSSGH